MSTKLERLINAIAPDVTLKPVFERANDVVNSFAFPDVLIESFDKFQYFLICFHRHLEAKILGIDSMPKAAVDFHWSRCYEILKQNYGINGEKTAFDMIRTNKEGGMREVVNQFTDTVARNYATNEINAKINFYINSLSVQERFEACDEYVEKFGHLLPGELTESTAVRIQVNFAKVLEKHVFTLYDLQKAAIQ